MGKLRFLEEQKQDIELLSENIYFELYSLTIPQDVLELLHSDVDAEQLSAPPMQSHWTEEQLEKDSAPLTDELIVCSTEHCTKGQESAPSMQSHWTKRQLERESAPPTQLDENFVTAMEDQPVTAITGKEKQLERGEEPYPHIEEQSVAAETTTNKHSVTPNKLPAVDGLLTIS